MWKLRLPKGLAPLFSKLRPPVLTGAEKSALGILFALLAFGGGLRAWERSGVAIGPVEDWDTLRDLVTRSPRPPDSYPCAEAQEFAEDAPRDGFVKAGAKKARKGGAGGKKTGPARPVDLNTANETQLNSLPGVGPSTAKAILAYRAAHGKFSAPEDLLNVKGIGPKKFEALQKFVRVPGSVPEPPPQGPVPANP